MTIIIAILIGLAGLAAGYFASRLGIKKQQTAASEKLDKAQAEASKILKEARQEADKIVDKASAEESKTRQEIKEVSQRLLKREKSIDDKLEDLDKRAESLRGSEKEIEELKKRIMDIRQEQEDKLEKIAKLKKSEAAEKIQQIAEKNVRNDLNNLIVKLQKEAKNEADEQARAIIVAGMERMASEVTAERTVTTVKLDNEDIKGRIIGKEGRNIQALQRATGVDFLVDDAPGTVVLSCFDPIRREVARLTIETLIKDGRIHPGRIEEVIEKCQKQVQKEVVKAAEAAVREVGVIGVPQEILQLLGELKYRTSYGQNVLKHSIEMAHLAGILSEQLGANTNVCKFAALVHDLGKALTHKMEGKHHHLSGEMLRKYGVAEDIAHAAEAHHDDIEATTVEAMIIRVVDAVSAARPGARNMSVENFIERMKTLENIANTFDGVEKSYAISAGREMRVFVRPKDLDDLQSIQIARDIATKIESTMNYAGTIKVTVIRETRAIEYAK